MPDKPWLSIGGHYLLYDFAHLLKSIRNQDFIKIVLGWWKIVSTHVAGADKALNDPLKAEIRECSDQRLQAIKNFGNLALKMSCQHGLRIKQLTRDNGNCIYHTFCGVFELCESLLQNSHDYVFLGQFSTDSLEKEFSKLRQGSGGAYFITVQQIIEKVNISKASLVLIQDLVVEDHTFPGHMCPTVYIS